MTNEAEMYHAAATVSTVLLKLGEGSRKCSVEQALTNKDDSTPPQWSLTFEQLIASLLTENILVTYFDQQFVSLPFLMKWGQFNEIYGTLESAWLQNREDIRQTASSSADD